MEERGQFTFYRSFYNALKEMPWEDREAAVMAVIEFALDGKEPEGLNSNQTMFFIMARPTLQTGRNKALVKLRNKKKKKEEKEEKKENKKKNEIEIESRDSNGDAEGGFECFWKAYPVKIAKEQARRAWEEIQPDAYTVMTALEKWKLSKQWCREDGRFIPRAWRWLQERHFEDAPEDKRVPMGATGVLGQAELEAIRQVMERSIE